MTEDVAETSCLRFSYVGNLMYLAVVVSYEDGEPSLEWNDHIVNLGFSAWRPAQVTAPHVSSHIPASLISSLYRIPYKLAKWK